MEAQIIVWGLGELTNSSTDPFDKADSLSRRKGARNTQHLQIGKAAAALMTQLILQPKKKWPTISGERIWAQ